MHLDKALRLQCLEALGPGITKLQAPSRTLGTWYYPSIPEPHFLFPAAASMRKFRTSTLDSHIPVSLAIFGGSRGQYLNKVRGLTLSMRGDCIVKLEILFCAGHSAMFFGPNFERSPSFWFPVDGPGGERITAIREIITGDDRRFRGFIVTGPFLSYKKRAFLANEISIRSQRTAARALCSHLAYRLYRRSGPATTHREQPPERMATQWWACGQEW